MNLIEQQNLEYQHSLEIDEQKDIENVKLLSLETLRRDMIKSIQWESFEGSVVIMRFRLSDGRVVSKPISVREKVSTLLRWIKTQENNILLEYNLFINEFPKKRLLDPQKTIQENQINDGCCLYSEVI